MLYLESNLGTLIQAMSKLKSMLTKLFVKHSAIIGLLLC